MMTFYSIYTYNRELLQKLLNFIPAAEFHYPNNFLRKPLLPPSSGQLVLLHTLSKLFAINLDFLSINTKKKEKEILPKYLVTI